MVKGLFLSEPKARTGELSISSFVFIVHKRKIFFFNEEKKYINTQKEMMLWAKIQQVSEERFSRLK